MKWWIPGLLLITFALLASFDSREATSDYSKKSLETFKRDGRAFSESLQTLKLAIQSWSQSQGTKEEAIAALRESRMRFKKIEAFMEYFFEYPVNLYNRAPVFELEEPYMEYQSPIGLQYIESLLLDKDALNNKKDLLDQCEVLAATAADIPAQIFSLEIDDAGLMDANRLELVRIISLGISGYDAPLLKSGIPESGIALEAMRENLQPLFETYPGKSVDSLRFYLNRSVELLEKETDFDSFDRLNFLVSSALSIQKYLNQFCKERGWNSSKHPALNSNSEHLFNSDAIKLDSTGKNQTADAITLLRKELGALLFNEKALSGNQSRNCASCHQPEHAFSDGLTTSRTLDGKGFVSRNAPTLYYAALQRSQFYDGRASSLEEQIDFVLQNPKEMDADLKEIVHRLNQKSNYKKQFKEAFPGSDSIQMDQVRSALATYERSLAPFQSPFDRYMSGDGKAMNSAARKGFNLFMGKAQCGTCHFAPEFNGLLPPYYEVSELEILGVPRKNSKGKFLADKDSGRFAITPIEFNNGAFKTPTVRNAALTAPYMHNGVFRNFRELIDFYNKGGGRGLGLNVPQQTLSHRPLGLSASEIDALIAFLEALSDPAKPGS